jgi:endonuclease/exonuclease/phosphatase (EEP) superfamily protein YafD
VIVGGDFNLHTDSEPDASQFQRLLADTGLVDVCAALGCAQPGRIDKFLFRNTPGLTIEPLSWQFETGVFIDGLGDPLSDHDALAVRFRWTVVP